MSEPTPCREVSFEQSLAELELIVRQLEEGNIGLNESLERYEQGVKRLKDCYGLLERAERRIELLERVDADGEPVTRPFADEASIDRHLRKPGDEGENDAVRSDGSADRTAKTVKSRPSRPPVNDADSEPGLF